MEGIPRQSRLAELPDQIQIVGAVTKADLVLQADVCNFDYSSASRFRRKFALRLTRHERVSIVIRPKIVAHVPYHQLSQLNSSSAKSGFSRHLES